MRVTIIFLLISLSGCFAGRAPSPQELHEASMLVDYAVEHLREGNLEQAEATFQVAYELAGLAAAIDGLGCVAYMREDYARAESLFWQAYDMDATYDTSLSNLALLYEVQGRKKEAFELYQKALSADPKNHRLRNNYAGFLYENNGAKAQVLGELLKAEALFNDSKIYGNIELIKRGK